MGENTWLRLTERWTATAKSVFLFDVQGSVAKSTFAGLQWLLYLRSWCKRPVHFWPFDGWQIPEGKSVVGEVYPAQWMRRLERDGRDGDEHAAYATTACCNAPTGTTHWEATSIRRSRWRSERALLLRVDFGCRITRGGFRLREILLIWVVTLPPVPDVSCTRRRKPRFHFINFKVKVVSPNMCLCAIQVPEDKESPPLLRMRVESCASGSQSGNLDFLKSEAVAYPSELLP